MPERFKRRFRVRSIVETLPDNFKINKSYAAKRKNNRFQAICRKEMLI